MKALLDTSVLVAGLVEAHPGHAQAFPWIRRIRDAEVQGLISVHSIAGTYAVLSSLPVSPRLTPSAAWTLIEQGVLPFVHVVELSRREIETLVKRMSREGLAGGVVYDALIAEAATKAGADCLVTLNTANFVRVAGGRSLEIREP